MNMFLIAAGGAPNRPNSGEITLLKFWQIIQLGAQKLKPDLHLESKTLIFMYFPVRKANKTLVRLHNFQNRCDVKPHFQG